MHLGSILICFESKFILIGSLLGFVKSLFVEFIPLFLIGLLVFVFNQCC
jgi:hypothetical protein